MKSDVFLVRTKGNDSKARTLAFSKLITALDPLLSYQKDEIVPVKLTIGDSQCTHHLNPELVKLFITHLKKKKTRPFLFDTNVIYKGERTNAVDHLTLANNKGFGHSKVGAPFIIADGLLGQDGKDYEINSPNIKKIKVPSFIGMLDGLVVLSHITGHILTGYAGSLKNVAMGMCCRSTKQVQHSSLKPSVVVDRCTACGCCIKMCPVSAISWKDKKAFIDQKACIGCGECICACKFDAILINWEEEKMLFFNRIVEVAAFILPKFKNSIFINFAFDITKECDCISAKDDEIISEDLGILASKDIVSLDKATADLLNKEGDVFLKAQGHSEYYRMLEYASRTGLGNLEYNLKIIE